MTNTHPLSNQYITCIRVYAWGLCVGGRLTHHLVSDTDRVLTKISHDSPGLDFDGILEQMDVLGGRGLADLSLQGRSRDEIHLSALVLYLFQWIEGIDKVVERFYRKTSVDIELPEEEEEVGWVSGWLQMVPLLSRFVEKKSEKPPSKARCSTVPLLDNLRTHVKHYKASLPSVLGLGDVSGNPIPLDAQYLAEEMNMKTVLGNSRLVEAFPSSLSSDWIDGALLVTACIIRSAIWWSALLDEKTDLADSFEELLQGGLDDLDVVRYLDECNFQERLGGVFAKLQVEKERH